MHRGGETWSGPLQPHPQLPELPPSLGSALGPSTASGARLLASQTPKTLQPSPPPVQTLRLTRSLRSGGGGLGGAAGGQLWGLSLMLNG